MGIYGGGYDASTREKFIPVVGARSGVGSTWQNLPSTAAEVNNLIGYTPTSVWLLNESSGTLSDSVTTNNFSTINGGTYSTVTPFAGASAFKTTDNSTDRADQGSGTPFDATTGSIAFLALVRLDSHPAGTRVGPQKFGSNGYQFQWLTTGVRLKVTDDAPANVFTATSTGMTTSAYTPLLFGVDRTADVAFVSTLDETVTGDTSSLNDTTTASVFRLGNTSVATGFEYVWMAGFEGAQADWDGEQTNIINAFWSGV